ncbi:MAG: GHMP kinase [Gammaproteobacteria bacterium]|nr:GHMP kinase [Gammaproteobacteria bacterium]
MRWRSQAPANSMILGEHSVVYGHPALACALDQFITIEWQARTDNLIQIESALGNHTTDIDQLSVHPNLKFACLALRAFRNQLPHGLTLKIDSDFSSTIGLGSSAAVLAAMLSGLNAITNAQYSKIALFEIGHQIIIEIQGRGSGTDLAASLSGGILYFEPASSRDLTPSAVAKMVTLPVTLPIILMYAGYKTPTAEVLQWVAHQWQAKPDALEQLYLAMGKLTRSAFQALKEEDFPRFYQQIEAYQQYMNTLGVNDEVLEQLIRQLSACPNIQAAKISGSGLGDCVLGLGSLDEASEETLSALEPYQKIMINMTKIGAYTQTLSALSTDSNRE